MLEMVFAKADAGISAHYDKHLVAADMQALGEKLRQQMRSDSCIVLDLLEREELLSNQPWLRESIQLRNVYTDPLNFLQVELLLRQRSQGDDRVAQAIMVTIGGVAAGMRNTG